LDAFLGCKTLCCEAEYFSEILGGDPLRVLKEVERVSHQMQAQERQSKVGK
jgi:hypothetical protein